MKKTLVILITLFALASIASAGTITVNPGDSIQAAITASANGDTIIVSPGTYVENLNMNGKAITLRSTDPTNAAIVTSTIIDGNSVGSVITCGSGETADTVIDGFVITNGAANVGGGMFNNFSSPTVSNCTFSGNTANVGGGGMCNGNNSSPTVSNCTFSGNTANYGGGGMGGGMWNTNFSSPTVSNCMFSGNTANLGGGMFNSSSSPTVTDSYFCFNLHDTINGAPLHADSGGNNMEFCPPPRPIAPEYEGDIDGDGDVDFEDFVLLAANWLEGTQ
ncbi:MAG: hypothetical protein FVQ82_14195 [Planctomycetes bacterium]|nr:hypothetical protein [Planctomycetota bacterium]